MKMYINNYILPIILNTMIELNSIYCISLCGCICIFSSYYLYDNHCKTKSRENVRNGRMDNETLNLISYNFTPCHDSPLKNADIEQDYIQLQSVDQIEKCNTHLITNIDPPNSYIGNQPLSMS